MRQIKSMTEQDLHNLNLPLGQIIEWSGTRIPKGWRLHPDQSCSNGWPIIFKFEENKEKGCSQSIDKPSDIMPHRKSRLSLLQSIQIKHIQIKKLSEEEVKLIYHGNIEGKDEIEIGSEIRGLREGYDLWIEVGPVKITESNP